MYLVNIGLLRCLLLIEAFAYSRLLNDGLKYKKLSLQLSRGWGGWVWWVWWGGGGWGVEGGGGGGLLLKLRSLISPQAKCPFMPKYMLDSLDHIHI